MRLIFFFILAFVTSFCNAQFGNGHSQSSPNTLETFLGAVKVNRGFINTIYPDTVTANAQPIKNYPGAQIWVNDTLYLRNITATKWMKAGAGSGGGGGSGTVESFSIVTANGFSGSVANSTTTPALTITTPITGILKGNGTAMSAAVAGTDYLTPTGSAAGLTSFPTFNQNTTGSASTLTTGRTISISGDLIYTSPSFNGSANVTAAGTLATVNLNVGTFGSATQASQFTVNGKGLITAASNVTISPAVGSITGLGTGVGTALAINTGSSGAFVVNTTTLTAGYGLTGGGNLTTNRTFTIDSATVFPQIRATIPSAIDPLFPITGTGTATGNVIGDLDGNIFEIQQNGDNFLGINPSNFASQLSATDGVASSEIRVQGDLADPTVLFRLQSSDGTNTVTILGEPIDNTITYTSGTHIWNGNFQLGTDNDFQLDGKRFHVFDGVNAVFDLNPSGSKANLRGTDGSAQAYLNLAGDGGDPQVDFELFASNGGFGSVQIIGDVSVSNGITYTADTHTFNGLVIPGTNDIYSLGDDTHRWSDVFVGPASIHIGTSTSDEGFLSYNTSTNVLTISSTGTVSIVSPTLTAPIFEGQASPTYAQGKLTYDTDNESLTFYNNESDISMQVGQEAWVRVRNVSGSTIVNGAAVYINGSNTGLPTIALAQGNAANTSAAVGLATHDIENNSIGYVTTSGMVRGLNTSGFSAGDVLYISTSAAGGLQNTVPAAPNYRSRIGTVGVSNASTGTILVNNPTNALGFGTANQILGMNSGATAQEQKTLAVGTAGTDFAIANSTNTITFNLPDASATARGAITTGTQTIAGAKTVTSLFTASGGVGTSTSSNANLYIPASTTAGTQTTAPYLFGTATTVAYRIGMRGSTNYVLTAGYSAANVIMAEQAFTEAPTGTHDIIAGFVLRSPAITNSGAATTNATTLYIDAAPSGITPVNGNYSLWVDAGTTRLDGGILGTATNDAATAGNVGEEVVAIQSTYTNYTTTATYQNVTSITLTAGDWDLSAFMTYSSNSATITAASNAIFVISTTTASAAGAVEGRNIAYVPQAALLGTSLFSESISPYRVSISGSTTYYLNTQATFTLGNPQYVGGLRARRTR